MPPENNLQTQCHLLLPAAEESVTVDKEWQELGKDRY